MIRTIAGLLLPGLLLLPSAPAAAQEWQVAREQFAFAGSRLEIHVDVEAGGTLRLIRGEPGTVRVAGRTATGFTAAGLTADERLTLSALSEGPVDYMVSVPEGVWVTVRLPDRHLAESVAGHARGRTFHWKGAARAGYHEPYAAAPGTAPSVAADVPAGDDPTPARAGTPTPPAGPTLWVPPADDDPLATRLFTTFSGAAPPAEVDLPDLRWVRSVTVRLEGDRFRVAASRPMAVQPGHPARLEIRPAGPPMDIVLVIPAATPAFALRTAGVPALRVSGGEVATLCSPVSRQWLSDGRRWVTFTPVGGTLQCEPSPIRRHEG